MRRDLSTLSPGSTSATPTTFDPTMLRQATAATERPRSTSFDPHPDHLFVAMLDGYRSSGGLARAAEVVTLCEHRDGPDITTLARWIVERHVISFEWQDEIWLPLFQFDPVDMKPRATLAPVYAELTPVFDPWELAHWFVQSNVWLKDATPVQTFGSDPKAVLNAARADRFIANGW